MAIDERVTTLYLGRSLTDLSWEQKFYETLTNHGFELYPSDNPFWVKFDGFNENSVMYTIEGTDIDDFPTFYIRDKGGKEQVDAVTSEPLRAKNVIVEFMIETSLLDEKAHLLYKTLGRGNAKIFLDGKIIEAGWDRADLTSRTKYFDISGAQIVFNRGQTWVEVLPTGNALTFN